MVGPHDGSIRYLIFPTMIAMVVISEFCRTYSRWNFGAFVVLADKSQIMATIPSSWRINLVLVLVLLVLVLADLKCPRGGFDLSVVVVFSTTMNIVDTPYDYHDSRTIAASDHNRWQRAQLRIPEDGIILGHKNGCRT